MAGHLHHLGVLLVKCRQRCVQPLEHDILRSEPATERLFLSDSRRNTRIFVKLSISKSLTFRRVKEKERTYTDAIGSRVLQPCSRCWMSAGCRVPLCDSKNYVKQTNQIRCSILHPLVMKGDAQTMTMLCEFRQSTVHYTGLS